MSTDHCAAEEKNSKTSQNFSHFLSSLSLSTLLLSSDNIFTYHYVFHFVVAYMCIILSVDIANFMIKKGVLLSPFGKCGLYTENLRQHISQHHRYRVVTSIMYTFIFRMSLLQQRKWCYILRT